MASESRKTFELLKMIGAPILGDGATKNFAGTQPLEILRKSTSQSEHSGVKEKTKDGGI